MGGPMLISVHNVVWKLVTILVVGVVIVTTTIGSDSLLFQVILCPRYVWKIHEAVVDTVQLDILLSVR